jgi:hypothetical protein
MTSDTWLAVMMAFAFIAIASIAIVIVVRFRKWLPQSQSAEHRAIGWMELIVLAIFEAGSVVAAARYVYRAWSNAPPGSIEKIGWSIVMLFIVGLAYWFLLALIDRRLNKFQTDKSESLDRTG